MKHKIRNEKRRYMKLKNRQTSLKNRKKARKMIRQALKINGIESLQALALDVGVMQGHVYTNPPAGVHKLSQRVFHALVNMFGVSE